MSKYSISEFVQKTAQRDASAETFELESAHMLEVKLDGMVWSKAGAMIAYTGDVKFRREGMLDRGVSGLLKKAITGEGLTLMKAEGRGRVYLADKGKKVQIIHLNNDTICVNGNDVLALEAGLDYDIKMIRSFGAAAAGGLFNIRISGTGHVAMTTHYEPMTLAVKPGQALYTDPNATVAWSGNLNPGIHTDVSLGTLFGRGSGESFQLKFEGEGWVVMQPYEESPAMQMQG
jgi:uncharacterized protein (AIM24 family)